MKKHSEPIEKKEQPSVNRKIAWWIGHVLLTGVAAFFTTFGVSLLIASYGLGDPFSFIMTFFAASLMTLISIVIIIGLVLRMWRTARPLHEDNTGEAGSQ